MLETVSLLMMAAVAPPASAVAAPAGRSRLERRALRLSPKDMFALAELARSKGDERTESGIYEALQKDADPDVRAEARFRLARIRVGHGDRSGGAILLRQILDEKPNATSVRLQLAQLLAVMGDEPGALRELRAARSGPLPLEVARLVDRFSEALRVRKPFGASFEVALAPDSNISRSTRSDTLGTIFGDFVIDEDSKARSGTGLAVRALAFRRVPLGGSDILVRASSSADLYRQNEFNDIAVDLAAGPEFRLGRGRFSVEAGATSRWFGQEPLTRSLRIAATAAHPVGPRTALRASASAALVDHRANRLQDGSSYSAQAQLEHALSPTTGVALSLSGDRYSARDAGYSTKGWRAGLHGWRDLGRATLTASAVSGRLRADERLVLFPEARRDRFSQLSLGATFRHLTYGGFAPTVRFTLERNRSNIAFYDWERKRTEFGVSRAF